MPKISITRVIPAEKEKVFSTITDFQNLPKKFPMIFKSITVEKIEGNTILTKESTRLAGRDIEQTVKHILAPSEKHEVMILEGDAKDSIIIERYETVPEGTKITIEGDFKLAGKLKLVGFLAKGKIEKGINEVLDEVSKVV